jgi:hypothetical protein
VSFKFDKVLEPALVHVSVYCSAWLSFTLAEYLSFAKCCVGHLCPITWQLKESHKLVLHGTDENLMVVTCDAATARLLNLIFLYKPILGAPRSSITEYVMDWRDRHWALLAGVICGLGNGFQFMGGQVRLLPLHLNLVCHHHRHAARVQSLMSCWHSKFSKQSVITAVTRCSAEYSKQVLCALGMTGSRVCGSRLGAGAATGVHNLGCGAVWGVLQVL